MPRLKGNKTGAQDALLKIRRPLREEKRETMSVCIIRFAKSK
jgi:hypothetical protein